MKIAIALITTIIFSSGCATAPKSYEVVNSKTINNSYDDTWKKVVKIFADNNIQIKTIAKDSGLISAESMNFDPNQADCPEQFLFLPIHKDLSLNVFVTKISEKQTLVKVNTSFNVTLKFDNNIMEKKCNSTGYIEKVILNKLN